MTRMLVLLILLVQLPLAGVRAEKGNGASAPGAAVGGGGSPPRAGVVTLEGRPVLTLKAGVLSFSPEERARIITGRLERLVRDPLFHGRNLTVVDGEVGSDIVVGDTILMTVTDADAIAERKAPPLLSREFCARINAVVEARNREYSAHGLVLASLYSLAATLALLVMLYLIRRSFPRLVALIDSWRGSYIRGIRIQSIELISEERIVMAAHSLLRGLRLVLLLGLFYLYIPLLLSFFPWTRGMAARLFEYLLTPVEKVGSAVLTYLPNIFFLLVIGLFTHYAIRLTRALFAEVGRGTITIPGFFSEWADPSFKIARFLILAFAAVVAFPYLPGSGSPAFKGISVFLGVLFSLGSTSAVANVVAGVILTYMRAFKLGDRVRIADTVGDVREKNLLVTRVRTIKNVDITIPNSMVLGSHIINYSSTAQESGLILNTTVTIGYDAPWRQVHQLLMSAARATENILESPAPFVLQTALNDFSVSYEINAYTGRPNEMAQTYSRLHQNIQDAFNEAGVEIMSPHYSTLRDGNRTTIPQEYLPRDYREPSFRVTRVAGERRGECPAAEGEEVRG